MVCAMLCYGVVDSEIIYIHKLAISFESLVVDYCWIGFITHCSYHGCMCWLSSLGCGVWSCGSRQMRAMLYG